MSAWAGGSASGDIMLHEHRSRGRLVGWHCWWWWAALAEDCPAVGPYRERFGLIVAVIGILTGVLNIVRTHYANWAGKRVMRDLVAGCSGTWSGCRRRSSRGHVLAGAVAACQ